MAFKMPHPNRRPSGVYHLDVRVPTDLMSVVSGTTITLPFETGFVTVRPADKVFLSLRTRVAAEAIRRHTALCAALTRH